MYYTVQGVYYVNPAAKACYKSVGFKEVSSESGRIPYFAVSSGAERSRKRARTKCDLYVES